jgi:hypothetical protein
MADLKLGRLPDRTPVKMSIVIAPELHAALQAYASIYALTYGVEEPLTELVPAMLSAFLETDRSFVRARDARGRAGQ